MFYVCYTMLQHSIAYHIIFVSETIYMACIELAQLRNKKIHGYQRQSHSLMKILNVSATLLNIIIDMI